MTYLTEKEENSGDMKKQEHWCLQVQGTRPKPQTWEKAAARVKGLLLAFLSAPLSTTQSPWHSLTELCLVKFGDYVSFIVEKYGLPSKPLSHSLVFCSYALAQSSPLQRLANHWRFRAMRPAVPPASGGRVFSSLPAPEAFGSHAPTWASLWFHPVSSPFLTPPFQRT